MVIVRTIVAGLLILFTLDGAVFAKDNKMVAYPLLRPPHQRWSFSGPFGKYDKAQLQRGLKVYKEVCSACHSLQYVAFRDLSGIGLSQEDIKAFAHDFQITDGPNSEGEMFERPAIATDYFPKPFANNELAAFANNGAVPPDLSVIAKAREVPDPFPGFITNLLTNYTTAGPDYIVSLLTGYRNPPENTKIAEGTSYNPFFVSGEALSMAPPLADDSVVYDDGAPQTIEQYAKDVAAFLMWTADPHMEIRKQTGFRVISFLIVLAILTFAVKRSVFKKLEQEDEDGIEA